MKTSVSISRFSAICILLTASAACTQKIEYVTPDWVRLIFPEENGTVAIDFFQPDETQVFRWEQRENATYKVSFDLNMHFENARTFDVGTIDSLVFTNSDLLEMLRDIDPDFSGSRRFFWKVEQNMDGNIRSSWRYFNAMPLVESFTDSRDGEVYGACQFVLDDGTLMTIMSENLRATEYSDGEQLTYPAKEAVGDGTFCDDPLWVRSTGRYYTWADATRLTWTEAKAAYESNEPVQGICPDGWHLPSMDEILSLREYLGADLGANAMKNASWWLNSGNNEITNSSGLSIPVTGFYWHEGLETLTDPDFVACYWTSTPRLAGMVFSYGDTAAEDDPTKAVLMSLYDDAASINIQSYSVVPGTENRMTPVRCIMDPM